MTALTPQALPALASTLPVPTYDRARVVPGIVHLGVGGFHRSHQAMYLDRLLADGRGTGYGICGVGVLPGDRRMSEVLGAQGGLYTLVVKHPDGVVEARVVGSLVRYLFAPDDPEEVVEMLAAPTTRIVSLTITEGGYSIDPVTGDFDPSSPSVRADLQPGAVPTTAFGLVTEALARRRQRGGPPFTIMSCDNIQGNGDVARRAFAAFARLRDAGLGAWVERAVAFPNSMVDRITPVTSDADRSLVAERFGIDDGWPVVCEPWSQWVLEDHFSHGRPPLEDVGVQLVADVVPYELMKLRLLNAGHQALCYLGSLSGHRYVHEVCQDPLFVRFLRRYMDEEATPTLAPVPGVDLPAYKQTLIDRFANAHVRDTLARLCADSSDRIPTWLVPVIRHQLAHEGPIGSAALVVASWARYAEGRDEQGQAIVVVDPLAEQTMAAARRQDEDPLAFLQQRDLFGDLADQPRFVAAYVPLLQHLKAHGAQATLEVHLGGDTRRGSPGAAR
jgi:mannitol 2-dehydrogenase